MLAFVQADCGSCAHTLQSLATVSRPGVRTMAIGYPSSAAELEQFAHGIAVSRGPSYVADNGSAAAALGVTEIDTVVVLDARGRIISIQLSPNAKQLDSALARLSP